MSHCLGGLSCVQACWRRFISSLGRNGVRFCRGMNLLTFPDRYRASRCRCDWRGRWRHGHRGPCQGSSSAPPLS
jgi:hypothetical protein